MPSQRTWSRSASGPSATPSRRPTSRRVRQCRRGAGTSRRRARIARYRPGPRSASCSAVSRSWSKYTASQTLSTTGWVSSVPRRRSVRRCERPPRVRRVPRPSHRTRPTVCSSPSPVAEHDLTRLQQLASAERRAELRRNARRAGEPSPLHATRAPSTVPVRAPKPGVPSATSVAPPRAPCTALATFPQLESVGDGVPLRHHLTLVAAGESRSSLSGCPEWAGRRRATRGTRTPPGAVLVTVCRPRRSPPEAPRTRSRAPVLPEGRGSDA